MQTITNLKDTDFNFFEKLTGFQDKKEVWLPFRENKPDPKEALKRMQALQKKYPPKIIGKEINLSELINELNV